MPFPLLVVVIVLLMSGLGGFFMGLSLAPTDMARAWLVVGATLFSSGMIVLALGFAARMLAEAITAAARRPTADVHEAAPVAGEATPAAPGRAGILAAGGAAALGAGVLMTQATQPEPASPAHEAPKGGSAPAPEGAPIEELEQDLFAVPPSVEGAAPVAPIEQQAPVLDLRLSPVLTMAESMPEPAVETMPDRPSGEPEPEVVGVAGRAPTESLRSEPEETVAQADPVASHPPVPGLIADDDLAALQMDDAPLAPLETLDVVGAYDSGGVRFTMYSDGSVHAAGPGGEQRYRSLEALRQRLDAGLPAV